MTPEALEFWKMVLHSPVAIALAGGLAGSFITLVVTLLKFRYDAKESKLAWERQEARRKEERAFDRKSKAYEDFFTCFETTFGEGISKFDRYFAPTIMRLMLYGPLPLKLSAHEAMTNFVAASTTDTNSPDYFYHWGEVKRHCNDIHTKMMEDIDIHFTRDDMEQWKKATCANNNVQKD